MAREEQFLGYGYSCGGSGSGSGGSGGGGSGSGGSGGGDGVGSAGRVSKKVKQKKVPQRGLGVAQLEKIRLEEQQKLEAVEVSNVLGSNGLGSPGDIAAFLPIPCPKFRSGVSSLHNSVFSLPSAQLCRQSPSVSDVIRPENLVQMSKQLSGSGGEEELKAVLGPWPRLWSGEYSLVGEKQSLDHGFGCEAQVNVNLPIESDAAPILPPLILPRRSAQYPQPPPPLMVNTTTGILQSSIARSQMELPSNQSSRSANYVPLWSGEEKMVGTKRSYPFSLESLQTSPLHRNLSSSYAIPASCRSDELALSSNGYRTQVEPRNKCIRGGPSSSSPLSKWILMEASRDDVKLSADFLTLAPPAVSPPLKSMHKRHLDYSGNQGHTYYEFESIISQESVKSQTHQAGPSGSVEQSFSFFPIKYQGEQTISCLSNDNSEKGETIDLNLKL